MEIKVLQHALPETPKQPSFRDRSKNIVLNLARSLSSNVSREANVDESVGQGKLYAAPKGEEAQNKQHVSSTDESVGQGKLYAPPPKVEKKQQPSEKPQNRQRVESNIDERVGQGELYAPPKVEKKQQPDDEGQNKQHIESSVDESVGQGKLYTPPKVQNKQQSDFMVRGASISREVSEGEESEDDEKRMDMEGGSHALKSQQSDGVQGWGVGKSVYQVSKGVAADLRGSLSQMKDMLIDKLAAVPIPADTLEHARHSMESIIREATQTAYGKTRDAMLRIRVRLVEVIPSLSPNETKKIVDDVEQQVLNMSSANAQTSGNDKHQVECGRSGISASTASAVSPDQPRAPSLLPMNMERLRSWSFFRSRL